MRSSPAAVHLRLPDYLAGAATKGELCPIVGAGASNDVKVPMWGELIAKLGTKLGVEVPADADRGQAVDILLAALQRWRGGKRLSTEQAQCSFVTQLREVLYEQTPACWTGDDDFLTCAPTLLALLALCVARYSKDRTFHLITYNFDCLIEEAVQALGHRAIAMTASKPSPEAGRVFEPGHNRPHPVLRESNIHEPLTVQVAHPHGLVCRSDAYTPETAREVLNDLVFGRTSYQRSSRSLFNIHNVWQISAYSSMVCFFYGWSFGDTVVQNIIDLGKEIRKHGEVRLTPLHYALMIRSDCSDEYLAGEQLHFEEQGIFRFLTKDFRDQKTFLIHLLRQLGVVVWQP